MITYFEDEFSNLQKKMLPFGSIINALNKDHLVDYIEKKLIPRSVRHDICVESETRKCNIRREFCLLQNANLFDNDNKISTIVDMVLGHKVPRQIATHYNIDSDSLYPIVISYSSIRRKKKDYLICTDIGIKISKAKLVFASAVRRIGFIIDKHGQWGVVHLDSSDKDEQLFTQKATHAAKWAHTIHNDADNMCINPPSHVELYPNMHVTTDNKDARTIKKQLAVQNAEMTLIRGISLEIRNDMVAKGITRWDDPKLNVSVMQLKGEKADIVNCILNANRNPTHINTQPIETLCATGDFFVDIETSSMCKGCTNFVFMIGVGHGKDVFECFKVSDMSQEEELRIVVDFLAHVEKLNCIRLLHWGSHEVSVFKKVEERHGIQFVSKFTWVDMNNLITKQRWCPKYAFDFSLKSFAFAMYKQNMITTIWNSECQDGKSAMHDWHVALESGDQNKLNDIEEYNRVDVVTTMEIWRYLQSINIRI